MRPNFLSIVIPCHNEQDVIASTHTRLCDILAPLTGDLISGYELVLVNNGSTDNTLEVMRFLQKTDAKIVIVDLRNNYGYQGSISAGLWHARGDAVISIDADLQDDPEKIPEMLQRYHEGFDMVLGIRRSRQADSFLKRFSAELYYKLLGLCGVKAVFNHGDFRLLSRELVEGFKQMPERNRYIRGMILELESRYACVYYDRVERKAGATKFRLPQLFGFALDGITSFTSMPIRFVTFFGFCVFVISVLCTLYVLNEKFVRGVDVPGWAFLSLIILFFGGVQSLFTGIIGEYLSKTYFETKQRPLFLVRKVYRVED